VFRAPHKGNIDGQLVNGIFLKQSFKLKKFIISKSALVSAQISHLNHSQVWGIVTPFPSAPLRSRGLHHSTSFFEFVLCRHDAQAYHRTVIWHTPTPQDAILFCQQRKRRVVFFVQAQLPAYREGEKA
jgi:hypothetical protein